MCAARYVGRVGGLAVALGVGAAALLGTAGAASAEDVGADGSTSSSSSTETSSSAADKNGDGPADSVSAPDDVDGPDSTDSAPTKSTATSTSTSTSTSTKRPAAADDPERDSSETRQFGAKRPDQSDTAEPSQDADDETSTSDRVEPSSPAVDVPAAAAESSPAPERTSMEAVDSPPAPATRPAPDAPAQPPAELLLLGATRRDIAIESPAYQPTIELIDGIIRGINEVGVPGRTYSLGQRPSGGGKVWLDQSTGEFSFLPDKSVLDARGNEQFDVLVSTTTPLVTALEALPLVGGVVRPIVVQLHQDPVWGNLLAPIIGSTERTTVIVPVGRLVPAGTPIAFTTKVVSFDGTPISVNYFPASGVTAGYEAPTVLKGPGLATPGDINPDAVWNPDALVPGLKPLREAGYNVVTWDPRGEFASGGELNLNSPAYEGRDVQEIISWIATQPGTEFDADDTGATDPSIGMVGGSYGGGIQLVVAGMDDRVDAIVPALTWNSLNDSLYPNGSFKSFFVATLLQQMRNANVRIDPAGYQALLDGVQRGELTPEQQALLAAVGPQAFLGEITTPTLFVQGTVDMLFPLRQAMLNAAAMDPSTPTKMIWYCGGHGVCLELQTLEQETVVMRETLGWLDRYLNGNTAAAIGPKFEWFDQNGEYHYADSLPTDQDFFGTPISATGTGGLMPIIPMFGGSGPQLQAAAPYADGMAAPAFNAVNLTVQAPGTRVQVVGSPTLTMTYSGVGTGRHVYAQIVDPTNGRVVGNIVTPVPVTLDGQEHTVEIPMEAIAYTMSPGDTLVLQVVSSATQHSNPHSFGAINISSMTVTLPTVGPKARQTVRADS